MQHVIEDMGIVPKDGENMIQNGFILTGSDAELLGRVLEEVKRTTLERSETKLNDMGALEVLVSYFDSAEKSEEDMEAPHISANQKSKRLFLGHVIGRQVSTDAASGTADL